MGPLLIHFLVSLLLSPVLGSDSDLTTVWVTPHEQYSSSIGVLGCKVNTNRIAYWPPSVDCTDLCVQLIEPTSGRSLYLLRIDQSGGAHDVSYDAWNYLYTGASATKKPVSGGAVPMQTRNVDMGKCKDLLAGAKGKLPLSAANSMNYVANCLGAPDSWAAQNYQLYNVLDPICTWGVDEKCTLDWPAANQAACPHTLGVPTVLKGDPVYNIQYGTGKKYLAASPGQNVVGPVVSGAVAIRSGLAVASMSAAILGMWMLL